MQSAPLTKKNMVEYAVSAESLIANKIMSLLYMHHRGWHVPTHCNGNEACFHLHQQRILVHVQQNLPITFVLPAFPAKSSNRTKTFNAYPDLGERIALRFLNELCDQIRSLYAPGANVIICSDGRVFNDLVMVSDEGVNIYINELNRIINDDQLINITTFGLDQYYNKITYAKMRNDLIDTFGEDITKIKQKIKNTSADKELFNGIHRFIFEDYMTLFTDLSRNQIRRLAKTNTYQVIQRSNAWGLLVKKHFPQAIRLSIHPQYCHSEKLGINLLNSKDGWATPWHRVILFDGKEHCLIKKSQAEAINAIPVYNNDQFSHYTLENTYS